MTDQQRLANDLRHACDLGAMEAIRLSRAMNMDSYGAIQIVGGLVFARVLEVLAAEYGLPMPAEEAVA